MTDDLINRLLACGGFVDGTDIAVFDIATALKSQAKRIAELEVDRDEWRTSCHFARGRWHEETVRAEKAEADIARLKDALKPFALTFDPRWKLHPKQNLVVETLSEVVIGKLRVIDFTNATAIAVAQGEKEKTDGV